jgi:hypothetical protein
MPKADLLPRSEMEQLRWFDGEKLGKPNPCVGFSVPLLLRPHGLMVLVNAPVPCADPALRAVEMAIDMQDDVQRLIAEWRLHGHAIGFGIGLAMGCDGRPNWL